MKKILILLVLGLFLIPFVFSEKDDMSSANITVNFPVNFSYTSATGSTNLPLLNATVRWNTFTKNITNVSFVFVNGDTRYVFTNNTMNGTGGVIAGNLRGDFTYRIQPNDLTADTAYTVYVEIRNTTQLGNDAAVNSTSISYTLDSISPSSTISTPLKGSTVVPSQSNFVFFEYSCTDSNLGNSTLHLNNQAAKSSTSGTTTPNSSTNAKFSHYFAADNSSVRASIVCRDLAGNEGAGSNITFSVMLGAVPPSVRMAQQSGKSSSVGNVQEIPQLRSTHLQQYGWAYLVVFVVAAFIFIKMRNK